MVNIEELRSALTKLHKWKSPGVDKIPNFWLNCLTSTHKQIALNFTNILQNPETAPKWLTEGTIYFLPKSQENQNPQNYRPITYLATAYKILTSVITERMYTFLEENLIFPQEQK